MRVTLLVSLLVGCSAEVSGEPASNRYSVHWTERAGGTCGAVVDTVTERFPMPQSDCIGTPDAAECDVDGRTLTGSITCEGTRCVFQAARPPGCASVYDLTFTPSAADRP